MTRKTIRRIVLSLALALALSIGVAATPGVTPNASALPPTSCMSAELERLMKLMELNTLRHQLSHLLEGGITSDEVMYVDRTLSAISALQDDIAYLESILYRCSKSTAPNPWVYRAALVKIAKMKAQLTKLEADALRAKLAVKHS